MVTMGYLFPERKNLEYVSTSVFPQVTQEALAKFQSSQMESTQAGIEHEESLLNESAARESSLNTQVQDGSSITAL